jgi:anti-sigma factor RsiW
MTQCWPEGALRAYLDGELPSEDRQRVAAHLGDCRDCDGLCSELAARAAHVSALLDLLPERGEAMPRPAGLPRRRVNWIGAAVALAAGLAVAAYLLPDRPPRVAVARPAAPTPAPAPPVADAALAISSAPVDPPAPRRPRPARRARPIAPEPAYFVALDDEPFESGVIMRVDVKPGNMQADIVFGPDGRAHAFRLVNASQRNF